RRRGTDRAPDRERRRRGGAGATPTEGRDPAHVSTDPRERALAFLNGFRVFKLVSVAVALGIPERLVDGAKTADELARETGANADALRRALRALAAQGALREEADGRFAATDVTPLLRRGVSGALGDVVV